MHTRLAVGSLTVLLVVSASLAAPLGTTFTYQGRLTSGGSPANGLHDLRFTLYDADVDGAPVGTTFCADNVSVSDGFFTVSLDFGAQFAGQQRFLEIEVRADTGLDCTSAVGFVILDPRQSLTAAPNALFASNADRLDGLDSTAFLTGVPNPLTLTGTSDFYIIAGHNLSTVNGASGVYGLASAASGQIYGVQGFSASTNGFGVFGGATSTTGFSSGGFFESASSAGFGVFGQAKAATGTNYGVYGKAVSPAGFGVFSEGNMHSTGVISGNGSGLTSVNAALLGGLSSSAFLQSVPNPLNLTGSGAHIIRAQNTDGDSGAAVLGLATAATGTTTGGRFESASDEGIGVLGLSTTTMNNGYTSGVHGQAASSIGRGVFGLATNASGENYGVWGQSASSTGKGVFGWASATSGTNFGVYGQSDSSTGRGVYGLATAATGANFGVIGESPSTSGRGVYGFASAATGTTSGGSFETSSSGPDATGVFGLASAFSGTTYGVWGQSNSTSGYGVIGINARTSGTTYGVYGRSSSPDGRGVLGWAPAYGGSNYGVLGQNDSITGYGVFALGYLGASATKSFRIDHPDDPANKYLLHYSAESPEVINFYRGSVLLDGAGQAVVELPHYFAKINTAPSYQLTAIGAPMPMLHVADVIDEAALSAGAKAEPGEAAPKCSFRIAGGAPGAKVSWRVEAVRNDRLVQQRGAPVEVEKQGREKGTYQHPELYGQPPEKGMNYDAERERPAPATSSAATPN